MQLALNCHDIPVNEEGHDIAPGKDGGKVVENIWIIIPVVNIHKSLVPEEECAPADDIYNNFVWEFDTLEHNVDLLIKRSEDSKLSAENAQDTKYHNIQNNEECWPEYVVSWRKSYVYQVKWYCVKLSELVNRSCKHFGRKIDTDGLYLSLAGIKTKINCNSLINSNKQRSVSSLIY